MLLLIVIVGWMRRFPYTVVDQDVHDVLGELGRNVKIDVHVSDAVKGRVRGGWRVDTVGSFLDRLNV